MTVLVGIACTDGVLIGSDSATTFGEVSRGGGLNPPSRIFTSSKIVVEDGAVAATSGQVGMGLRFKDVVNEVVIDPHSDLATMRPMRFGGEVAKNWIKDLKQTSASDIPFSALVAANTKDGPTLLELESPNHQPEQLTGEVWHTSQGSGRNTADPLLVLSRRMFSPNGQPDMRTGLFCMCFVLKLTCEIAALGVEGPIHVASLTKDGASKLSREDLEEHEENIEMFIAYGGRFLAPDSSAPTAPGM